MSRHGWNYLVMQYLSAIVSLMLTSFSIKAVHGVISAIAGNIGFLHGNTFASYTILLLVLLAEIAIMATVFMAFYKVLLAAPRFLKLIHTRRRSVIWRARSVKVPPLPPSDSPNYPKLVEFEQRLSRMEQVPEVFERLQLVRSILAQLRREEREVQFEEIDRELELICFEEEVAIPVPVPHDSRIDVIEPTQELVDAQPADLPLGVRVVMAYMETSGLGKALRSPCGGD